MIQNINWIKSIFISKKKALKIYRESEIEFNKNIHDFINNSVFFKCKKEKEKENLDKQE